jgi:hypothetical protein
MKVVYQANDGEIFETEIECINYENTSSMIKNLAIELEKISYFHEYEFNVIEDIAETLINNLDIFKQYLSKPEYFPNIAEHVDDTKFELWHSKVMCFINGYIMEDMRDAYWQGYCEAVSTMKNGIDND